MFKVKDTHTKTKKSYMKMGYNHITLKINGINFHFTTLEEIEQTKVHVDQRSLWTFWTGSNVH